MSFPNKRIDGILAATFAPLTEEGRLNLDIIPKYVDHLQEQGVKGVFVNGTTGEGLNFTVEERKRTAEKWIECARGILEMVIIQIGGSNLEESLDLAKHAEESGADAIAALPPVYYRPKNVREVVIFLEEIAAAAPKTPLYYYHIPQLSGVQVCVESLFEEAVKSVPTFSGAKLTTSNLLEVSRCVRFRDRKYQVFYGGDEVLLAAMALGATTAVGGTYSFTGRIINDMMDAFKRGDLETAMRHQFRVQDMVKVLQNYGGDTVALKAMMNVVGIQVGPPRKPAEPLTDEQITQMTEDLKKLNKP